MFFFFKEVVETFGKHASISGYVLIVYVKFLFVEHNSSTFKTYKYVIVARTNLEITVGEEEIGSLIYKVFPS